jgi:hypothetical protein
MHALDERECSLKERTSNVQPRVSTGRRSLGALRSAQRRHPRSESHRRFLDSCFSFGLNIKFLAKSNVVSELEEKDIDPSIEQSADTTVEAAEHMLEHSDVKYSSGVSIEGLKLCIPLPT